MKMNRIHPSDCRCRDCGRGSRPRKVASLSNVSSATVWRTIFAFYGSAAIAAAWMIWEAAR